MNSSATSSATNTSPASSSPNTTSPWQAPTSSPDSIVQRNVCNRNEGGAARAPASSSAPSASTQVFKGAQIFMEPVENHNIYADSASGPQQPLQTFTGKQQFKEAVTNVNEAGSHGRGPRPQTKMQDMGDGIRVSVPLQHFDGDQEFHGNVTNTNTLNSNNNNYNSGNIGCNIDDGASVPRRQPAVPPADFYTLDDSSTDTIELLQSFTGGQKFLKDVNNINTISSNNNNYNSGNIGGTIRNSTPYVVNFVDVSARMDARHSAAAPVRSAEGSWTKRIFRKNPLQLFHGRQKFMGNVTSNNTINSNNSNVNSGNRWTINEY